MLNYLTDVFLGLVAGLNVAFYASDGHSVNLGVGVACGIVALVRRPR